MKISHTKPTEQIAIFKVTFDSSKFVLLLKSNEVGHFEAVGREMNAGQTDNSIIFAL